MASNAGGEFELQIAAGTFMRCRETSKVGEQLRDGVVETRSEAQGQEHDKKYRLSAQFQLPSRIPNLQHTLPFLSQTSS